MPKMQDEGIDAVRKEEGKQARREKKRKPRMLVTGKRVFTLQQIIREKAKKGGKGAL